MRAGSFRHSSPGCEHDGLAFIDPFRPRLGQVRPVLFGYPKGFLKAEPAARTIADLEKAIGSICSLFTPEECSNYFMAAGYGFN